MDIDEIMTEINNLSVDDIEEIESNCRALLDSIEEEKSD